MGMDRRHPVRPNLPSRHDLFHWHLRHRLSLSLLPLAPKHLILTAAHYNIYNQNMKGEYE